MAPFSPRMARQMMVREEMSRKNGMVSNAMTTARVLFEAPPLASQSANGKAMTRSMTVTVSAMRSVRRLTPSRPDSSSEIQVLSEGS